MYLGLINQRQTTRGSHKELYNNEKQPCARTQTVLPKRGPRANAPLHTSSHGKHWEGEQGEHPKHLDRNEQQGEGKAKISSCQSSKRGGFHSIWVPRCAWTWEIPSTAPWSCVMLEVHPSLTPGHPWQLPWKSKELVAPAWQLVPLHSSKTATFPNQHHTMQKAEGFKMHHFSLSSTEHLWF